MVKNVYLKWNAPVYSDSRDEHKREALVKRISPKPLCVIEPRHIEAFKLFDCEYVRIEDCVCPDLDC